MNRKFSKSFAHFGMVRQDSRVQHVGIAQHHVGAGPDSAARVLRRVPVVGVDPDFSAASLGDLAGQLVQLRHLVLRQRLGWEQVKRARGRVLQDRVEDRQVVAERLARGRRRGDDDVPAGGDLPEGFGLVGVEIGCPASRERGDQSMVELVGERRKGRRRGRYSPYRGDDAVGCVRPFRGASGRQHLKGGLERELLAFLCPERRHCGRRRRRHANSRAEDATRKTGESWRFRASGRGELRLSGATAPGREAAVGREELR